MASINGATIPEWRERQLLRPTVVPLTANPASPNRKELRGHIARLGRVVPGTDRKLGESPFQAKLRKAARNAVAVGLGRYEAL